MLQGLAFLLGMAFSTQPDLLSYCALEAWRPGQGAFMYYFQPLAQSKASRSFANGDSIKKRVSSLYLNSHVAFSTGVENVNSIMHKRVQFKVTFCF